MRERDAENHLTINCAGNVTGNAVQAGVIHGGVHFHPSPAPPPPVARVDPVRPETTVGEVFVGREEELARVLAILDPDAGAGVGAVVSAVAGMGGVGKTALARHAAVEALRRGWFGGGVFWVDLRGYDHEGPVPDAAVFGPLLRRLGVPDERIPDDPVEQAAAYDQVLTQLGEQGRAVLLVCDNAGAGRQVRGLVPGPGPHRVLVTTRDTLDLPRARRLSLDVLDTGAAVALLDRVLDEQEPDDRRLRADSPGAEALARACGRLPLALRIAGALLADEPHLRPGELADQLRSAPGVEGYAHGEQAVAAVFDLSWQRLLGDHPEWAGLLRLLCLNPGPDTSTDAAAALADEPPERVRVGLRGLRQAHLLRSTGPDRWGLHDLIRAHTGSHSAGLDPDRLAAAELRVLGYYATTADQADDHLRALPGQPAPDRFAGRADALEWLDAERATLVAAVVHATTSGHHDHAVRLGAALAQYLDWRHYLADAVTVADRTHTSATHLSARDQAMTANNLGVALGKVRRFEEAVAAHERAGDLYRELGDRRGEAMVWNNLGVVLRELRRFEEAVVAHERAGELHGEVGNRSGEATVWNNLGLVLRELRRFEEAIVAHERAGDLYRELGDRRGEAMVWNNLGVVLQQLRRFEEAVTAHERAGELHGEVGNRHGEAGVWNNLGMALRELRRFEEAIAAHERAGERCWEMGDRHGEAMAWNSIGLALRETRRFAEAAATHRRAGDLFREVGDRQGEATAWGNLGMALRELRRFEEAATAHRRDLAICRELGDRYGEAQAWSNLGAALSELRRFEEAVTAYRRAGELFRGLGDRYGEARAWAGSGLVLLEAGRREEATRCGDRAWEIFTAVGDAERADAVDRLLRTPDVLGGTASP